MELEPDRPVTLAVIIGAHGVTGEVRLKLFCDSVDSLKAHKSYNSGALTLTSVRAHKAGALARFTEIADRNAAEALRGTELTVPRSALPDLADDEFYYEDMIGLPCVTDNGEAVGAICAVYDFGAGDIFEIAKPDGKKFMVPAAAVELAAETATIDADFIE